MTLENKHILHHIYTPLPHIFFSFYITFSCCALSASDFNQAYHFEQAQERKKPKPILRYDSTNTIRMPFEGTLGYMAIRGNNFFTGLSDFIITYSLNNEAGTLLNKQKHWRPLYQIQPPLSSIFNHTAKQPSTFII